MLPEWVVLIECSCKKGEKYLDGTPAKFYKKKEFEKALKEYAGHKAWGSKFFGIHIDNLHIVGRPDKLEL